MKPTHRTQPHRAARGRRQTAAVAAMRRGKPAFLPNPMAQRRRAQGRRRRPKRLRDILRSRY